MDIRTLIGTLQRVREVRWHERWTRPQLEAPQKAALRRLRDDACAWSPFDQQSRRG